jgi:Flp pilus assembly protein TadD
MSRSFQAHLFKTASAALMAALAGCAPLPATQPTLTSDTRERLAKALQDSGDSADAAIVRSQTGHQAAQRVDPLTHATALVTAGQVDEGIKVARASLGSHADDLPYSCEVGRLAVRSGRLKDAGEVYEQILQRHPDSPEALNGMGVVLAQLGDLNGAADAFRKALALHPHDAPASHNLSLVMALTGQHDGAAIRQDDSHPPEEVPQARSAPAAGDQHIVLRARGTAWMQVRDASGHVLLDREMHNGESWRVPNKPGLELATGNAGATEIVVDGEPIGSLGGGGQIRRDIALDPDRLTNGSLAKPLRSAKTTASPAANEGVSAPR